MLIVLILSQYALSLKISLKKFLIKFRINVFSEQFLDFVVKFWGKT